MDLDETVLDNSTFQTYLFESGQNYSDPVFNEFVSEHRLSIRLVPVRKTSSTAWSHWALRSRTLRIARRCCGRRRSIRSAHSGVNVKGLDDPAGLRLLTQVHGESIKKPGRDLVRAKYHVLAYFGDQLGDFSDEFAATNGNTAAARVDLAAGKYRELWGTRWFVLPNPVYGQWQVVLLKAGDRQFLLARTRRDSCVR